MNSTQITARPCQQSRSAPCTSKKYGDAQLSFESVYAFSHTAIFSHALHMLRKRDVAEEIVQEVFLYAWINSEKFDESRSSLLTWLLMLCRSRAIDYMRAQTAGSWLSFFEVDETAAGRQDTTPESLYETGVYNRAIHSAIELLTSAQREVIVLNYYRELSHGEIADALNMPLGSVKTLIRRARLRLACNSTLVDLCRSARENTMRNRYGF
ncbi:RNA polymerase sigma factor [Duganella levis]|uniref:Sigma-70 family RNA polymerase sigma factor n=1 Tax=Duganella levis TaxID=2692169 RepID=A0ABW9VT82_9BURK|nr:RNA polymerase sigma factor [Duganella levis]MYN24834.1 sigma-70 family RNA polymerase sigma factor [Duganella levis]